MKARNLEVAAFELTELGQRAGIRHQDFECVLTFKDERDRHHLPTAAQRSFHMIDRQKGKLVLECDSCAEVFEGDNGDFGEVWSAAKRDGWSTYRIGEQWMHRCPRCGSRPKGKAIVGSSERKVLPWK